MRYSSDNGSTWKDLVLPTGVYNYINLNAFLLKNETSIKSEDEHGKDENVGFSTQHFQGFDKVERKLPTRFIRFQYSQSFRF